MREIKFRIWDKAINKMITQENVKEFLDKTISEKWEDEFPYHCDEWYPAYEILTVFDYLKSFQERTIKRYEPSENRFELMQFTGLHDKNGKEIYEGDIVKSFFVDTDEAGNEIYKYYIIEVKYDEILCSYKIDKFMNLEVIGNIYENKELLNETNR